MLGGDWTDGTMTDFKWRHFQGDVILWAVRWYCRYPISYRDLEEMLAERGISVDQDRKSVVSGTSVSVRVDLGGRRIIKKKLSYNYREVSKRLQHNSCYTY